MDLTSRLLAPVAKLSFAMNTTYMEPPEVRQQTESLGDENNVLQIGNIRGQGLGDILGFLVLFAFLAFCLFAGCALVALGGPNRLVGIVCVAGGVLGAWGFYGYVCQRIAYNRDDSTKLTLSNHAFCDHRTGVKVALADVESIRFINDYVKSVETRANLRLTKNDGVEHEFDLRALSMPSKEIAWRVTTNAGIEDAEGVKNPAEETLGAFGYVLGGLLGGAVIWQIYLLAAGQMGN